MLGDGSNKKNDTSTSTELPIMSKTPHNPDNAATAAQGGSDPLTTTDKTGIIPGSNPLKAHDVVPTERSTNPGAAPDSGAAPKIKQQGADKPSAEPSGDETSAIKEKKDNAEDILKNRDPNDHSGEPMRMHDGPEKVPSTQEERRTSKAGMPGGQEHGKEPKGTGEQWVKSTGTAADGGDFDATKPGAGREADRTFPGLRSLPSSSPWHKIGRILGNADSIAGLLEQKGITKGDTGAFESSSGGDAPTSSSPAGEHKEKQKLTDKLKDKLHLHRHKDKESK